MEKMRERERKLLVGEEILEEGEELSEEEKKRQLLAKLKLQV